MKHKTPDSYKQIYQRNKPKQLMKLRSSALQWSIKLILYLFMKSVTFLTKVLNATYTTESTIVYGAP
jgi:hypothetical protein